MAKDMRGLYEKVTKGVYPNLPKHYSSDLYLFISKSLTVDPHKRPSAEQLLHTDIVLKRLESLRISELGTMQNLTNE
jgi:NIMA (never in mitosis gene a)-related kinase